MSGLREAFDQIVADVPVYGDLDRAIEQAERERRHRYGVVAGLVAAAAVVAVIIGLLAVTRDGNDPPQPVGPTTPTPTETPTDTPPASTAPLSLPANGRLARAEDLFARATEPCSVITADDELATPGADCVIWAQDVDATASIGLFEENPIDTGNDPDGPAIVTTLRVATRDAVIGQFPSPYGGVDAELGPGPDEISLPHGRDITVVGFDGSERRSIDLSSALVPPQGDTVEEIRSLEWSPDGTRVAVVSRLHTAEGMSSQIWIVDRDDGQPQLVHTATNTGSVPANNTPLTYIWSVAWSPDGGSLGFIEEFAYIGRTEVAQSRRAAILTLSGSGDSAPRTLYDYASSTVYDEAEVLWSPDGARVALRVPDQVLELSPADGRILDRHPLIAGKLVWLAREK
jgi:dipeptidyl aminopeptidase/acylaminoacyl peptidase